MAILHDAAKIFLGASFLAAAATSVGAAGPGTPLSDADTGTVVATLAEGFAGTVTTAAGEPVAGVLIQPEPIPPTPPVPDIAILTSEDGAFGFPLGPGTYHVTLLLEGSKVGEAEVTVEVGRVTRIDFRIDG